MPSTRPCSDSGPASALAGCTTVGECDAWFLEKVQGSTTKNAKEMMAEQKRLREAALDLEGARKRGESLPPDTPLPEALYYREVVRFSEQLKRYQKHFKSNQIRIILQDDLIKDTATAVSETFSFLGVDCLSIDRNEQENCTSSFD
mgnify:CR=1 FL=1